MESLFTIVLGFLSHRDSISNTKKEGTNYCERMDTFKRAEFLFYLKCPDRSFRRIIVRRHLGLVEKLRLILPIFFHPALKGRKFAGRNINIDKSISQYLEGPCPSFFTADANPCFVASHNGALRYIDGNENWRLIPTDFYRNKRYCGVDPIIPTR